MTNIKAVPKTLESINRGVFVLTDGRKTEVPLSFCVCLDNKWSYCYREGQVTCGPVIEKAKIELI